MYNPITISNNWMEYYFGSLARWYIFLKVLKERGNNHLAHVKNGQQPVFYKGYEWEMIMDGRDPQIFERPVNFALVRMIDRRNPDQDRRQSLGDESEMSSALEKRVTERREGESFETKKPVVIIDPRAGHGPGIGGIKIESQIGNAMNAGCEVYFILFYPNPEVGQTVTDVARVQAVFIEKVIELHDGVRPLVVTNCQAGWSTAILAAVRPELIPSTSLHGSPLSYWSGLSNPMRIYGGLIGGEWIVSLCSDLGNGKLDGAWLVTNFERLNLANTYWRKLYNVYAHPDPEKADTFLDFERWWGGYVLLSREEMRFIVKRLFIGNELEQGLLQLEDGTVVNLRNLKEMSIVINTSDGDNITPPPQALGWLGVVFKSMEEIIERKLKIVFYIDKKVGHLGLFMGSEAVAKQQNELFLLDEVIRELRPGIYEVILSDNPTITGGVYREEDPKHILYGMEIVERDLDYVRILCGPTDIETFSKLSKVSHMLDDFYCTFISPYVRSVVSEPVAEIIRNAHPLRMQQRICSDLNPWMSMVEACLPWVQGLQHIAEDNPFLIFERAMSENASASLGCYQEVRDKLQLSIFENMYSN